jgi:hypothetical protein
VALALAAYIPVCCTLETVCSLAVLRIFEQTELDQYIVVLAKIEETAALEPDKEPDSSIDRSEPLIRYNRLYATIDQERLSQGNDRYPV